MTADRAGELIFEVAQEEDGGFVAECLTEAIFMQADTWDELRHNVKEAKPTTSTGRRRAVGAKKRAGRGCDEAAPPAPSLMKDWMREAEESFGSGSGPLDQRRGRAFSRRAG